jgi:hypothetical protein
VDSVETAKQKISEIDSAIATLEADDSMEATAKAAQVTELRALKTQAEEKEAAFTANPATAVGRVEKVEVAPSNGKPRIIIVDTGSGFVKLGLAEALRDKAGASIGQGGTQPKPFVVVRNVVGMPKYPQVMINQDLETKGFAKTAVGSVVGLYKGDNPERFDLTNLPGSPGDKRMPNRDLYDVSLKNTIETYERQQDPPIQYKKEEPVFTFDNGLRGVMKILKPMKYGVLQPGMEDAQEEVWQHSLKELSHFLKDSTPEWSNDYVLATEAPLNKVEYRERMVTFFKAKNFKGIYVGSQAILAMYGYQEQTGLILDIGDGCTHIVPIFEGFALPHAIKRLDIGGEDITIYLGRLLTEREDNYGRRFVSSAEQEILRRMKERIVSIAPNDKAWQALNRKPYGKAGTRDNRDMSKKLCGSGSPCDDAYNNPLNDMGHYTLPDGSTISYADQRWRMYEPLFDPMLIGVESPGIQELMLQSIKMCDMDIRRRMYGQVLLSGGTCEAAGFGNRVEWELGELLEKDFNGIGRVTKEVFEQRKARKPVVTVRDEPPEMSSIRDAVYAGAFRLPGLTGFNSLLLDLQETGVTANAIWKYADVQPNRHVIKHTDGEGKPLAFDAGSANPTAGWDGDRPGVDTGDKLEDNLIKEEAAVTGTGEGGLNGLAGLDALPPVTGTE